MENGNKINIWWLFLAGSVLVSAGWFMKPFPVFMFIGLAPFFAILDHTVESDNFWEHIELILLGMVIYFFGAFQFDSSQLVKIIFLAIVFTLPFLTFSFAHENMGPKTGKFIVIVFWLAIEFVLLSIHWPADFIYLADSFQFTESWFRWDYKTGYLGVSAWILMANWILYAGVLRGSFNWYLITLGLVVIAGPILYSLLQDSNPIVRQDMVELYKGNTVNHKEYLVNGELVARTCAWLSPLIILFALVKSRINT